MELDTKQIKTLINNDDNLQWWAAIFFAELYGYVKDVNWIDEGELARRYPTISSKLRDFDRIIIQEKINEVSQPATITERIAKLEQKVFKTKENQNASNPR